MQFKGQAVKPPRVPGIYLLRNLVTKKVYVGQTVSLRRRWTGHFRLLALGRHSNQHLQAAFNKYGANNFEYEVVEECELSVLDGREAFWIKEYTATDRRFGYNIEAYPRGTGPRSAETRRRLSVGNARCGLGKEFSAEHRRNISLANKGIPHGPQSKLHKKRLSAAQKKRFATSEGLQARADAQRKKWQDPAYRAQMSAAHTGQKMPVWTEERRAKFTATVARKKALGATLKRS